MRTAPDPFPFVFGGVLAAGAIAYEVYALSPRGRAAGAWSWSDCVAYLRDHPWFGPLSGAALGAASLHLALHDGKTRATPMFR